MYTMFTYYFMIFAIFTHTKKKKRIKSTEKKIQESSS